MTNKRKALLAAAVAALLTVPGVALASGAFDGGNTAIVDEVTTIGEDTSPGIADDSVADDSSDDPSDDVDEATEVEDSADDLADDSADDLAGIDS